MFKRKKIWISVGVATISTSALIACSPDTEQQVPQPPVTQAAMTTAQDGEGEGAAPEVNIATDDLAYLTQLGLVRGHLHVGYQLYMDGHLEHAKTHMKHPESELYSELIPAFDTRGTKGFANELSQLANAVNQDLGTDKVEHAYQQLIQAIEHNEQAIQARSHTPAERLKLAAALLRVAGEEYALAVIDGKMENVHEYQDALGFSTISHHIINQLSDAATRQKATALIDSILPLWPSLIPPATLDTNAGQIYGVAAKLDLLAASL